MSHLLMRHFFKAYEEIPAGDIQLVSQLGGVDLRVAYSSGVVPGDLEGTEDNSNGIESPSAIIGRPDDVFSLHRASSAYHAAAAPAAAPSAGSPNEAAPA